MTSCSSELVEQINLQQIKEDDIELFNKIGINARFVSNKSKARFQWRNNESFCNMSFEDGNLSSKDCEISNFGRERAKKIVKRFLELDLTGITDINGEGNIIFRKGNTHYLYNDNITLQELKIKMPNLKSMDLIKSNWYLLKLKE